MRLSRPDVFVWLFSFACLRMFIFYNEPQMTRAYTYLVQIGAQRRHSWRKTGRQSCHPHHPSSGVRELFRQPPPGYVFLFKDNATTAAFFDVFFFL